MNLKKTILYILLPSLILVPVIFLLILAPKNGWGEGENYITGRYVETASGRHMLIQESDLAEPPYVFLLPRDDAAMFDRFETGDAIRVKLLFTKETENDLLYAEVWDPQKVWDLATIPKLTEDALSHIETLDAAFSQGFS